MIIEKVKKELNLESLSGLNILDGVDFVNPKIPEYDRFVDSQLCRFRLNGTTYMAVEDPNDGYRSSMRYLLTSSEPPANIFEPIEVCGVYCDRTGYNHNDIIKFYCLYTGKLVLEVGTDNSDNYYPCFVAAFYPENIKHNDRV